MKVAKRVNLKSSHHGKKIFCNCLVIDVNYTYSGDNFVIYTNVESLCDTPETNGICQLYINFLKREHWHGKRNKQPPKKKKKNQN